VTAERPPSGANAAASGRGAAADVAGVAERPRAAEAVPTTWTTGTTEVFKTGTWRSALPQHIRAPSPCHAACPVGGEIALWIGRARARDFRGAWEILTRHNPFPAVAGRVCHHPCEAACNRVGYDASLAICRLERYVGDRALAEGWGFAPGEVSRPERVAVVGGGPSGLAAAFHLRRLGYAVTLFESRAELGGLMRYGIPSYRLARSVLDGEIARIVALGVDVRCGEALETPEDFARLRAAFDAVYLAVGARCQKRLPRLDYSKPWVLDGADYLARANAGAAPPLGRRVVVIGGGSAAIDVARSARRAGHEVTIVAIESAAQMPAQREEVAEALEEGVALVDGSMLTEVVEAGDAGLALRCVRVCFAPGAQRGEFTVTPLAGSEFTLAADAIVTSIGQDPDLAPVQSALATAGALLRVDAHGAAGLERVYAGGDVASMARFVTEAIGMGQRAALAIDSELRGTAPRPADGTGVAGGEAVVALASINTFYHPAQARVPERRLEPGERLRGDAEVQLGLDLEQTLAEAERCFSCGTCILCDNCVHYCPDLAVQRDGDGYLVLTDYCKGCGICVKECPTGSMKMVEEAR
jgi:NADPH-dependent glutamate synthase beta subunit-like oxidoreductase